MNAKATKRKPIQKLTDISIKKAEELYRNIKGASGVLRADISLKVDGAALRLGKDAEGRFFIESARSGPIYNYGEFFKFAKANGKDTFRASCYDEIFRELEGTPIVECLPNNTKVVAEVLFLPLGHCVGGHGWRCVDTVYDRSKLGTTMTLFILDVLSADTGEEHSQKNVIVDKLLNRTSSSHMVVNPLLRRDFFAVDFILQTVKYESDFKGNEKSVRENLKSLANQIAKETRGKRAYGKDWEALVLKTEVGTFKIPSQK